jgi:RNA polymerase sigma factor (TIGR02999 family)
LVDIEPTKDITLLLKQCQEGDESARERLFSAIDANLRELATRMMRSERVDHTLQATGLVNEACVKVLRNGVFDSLENRRHLFSIATKAMQQVLVDHARKRNASKRGGDRKREAMDIVLDRFEDEHGVDFSELEQALEKLMQHSERQHQVVTLRFFSGLSIVDTAEILGCSKSTVESDWRWARAKLFAWLNE